MNQLPPTTLFPPLPVAIVDSPLTPTADAASKKKMNNACHFCDHAAVRSGRRKIAMQVACTRAGCKKVFCSRPSCIKKLPEYLNVHTYDDFALWKHNVDSGIDTFVCPHCQDERTCGGPQCLKRYEIKKNRKAQSSGSSTRRKSRSSKNNSSELTSRASSPSPSSSSSGSSLCELKVPRPLLHRELDPGFKAELFQNLKPLLLPSATGFSLSPHGAFSLVSGSFNNHNAIKKDLESSRCSSTINSQGIKGSFVADAPF
jgi:hypothetical protein